MSTIKTYEGGKNFVLVLFMALALIFFIINSENFIGKNLGKSPLIVALLVLVGISFIAFYLFNPWLAIAYLLITRPLFDQLHFISDNFLKIYGGALFLILCIHILMNLDKMLKLNLFLIAIYLFIIGYTVSLLRTQSFNTLAISSYTRTMVPVLGGLLAYHFCSTRNNLDFFIKKIRTLSVPMVLIPVSLTVLSGYLSEDITRFVEGGLFEGTFKNTHNIAHWMSVVMALCVFYLAIVKSRRQQATLLLYFLVSSFIIVLTSRLTPLVGFASFFLVFNFLSGKSVRMVLVMLAGLFLVFAVGDYRARIEEDLFPETDVATDEIEDSYGSGRAGIWRASIANFNDGSFYDKLIGNGMDAEVRISPLGSYSTYLSVHNDNFVLLFTGGLVTLFLYLTIQGLAAVLAWKIFRISTDPTLKNFSVFTIGFTAMVFLTNSASNSYVSRIGPHLMYWIALGMIAAIYYQLPDENSQRRLTPDPADNKPAPRTVTENENQPRSPVHESSDQDPNKWLFL